MKFNSQICTTKEQSERLLALGLKEGTADMTLQTALDVCYTIPFQEAVEYFENRHLPPHPTILPAWSLHRLIEMVPITVKDASGIAHYTTIDEKKDVSFIYFGEETWEYYRSWSRDNLYDNLIDCIEWLIEKGCFNKEYLEE